MNEPFEKNDIKIAVVGGGREVLRYFSLKKPHQAVGCNR
jgi:hypothetical protein